MKHFQQQMDDQADLEDFNPFDILNAFKQLTDPQKNSKNESANVNKITQIIPIAPYKDKIVASPTDKDNLPKKTVIIKKQSMKIQQKQRSIKSVRHQNQNSLGRISNISRSVGGFEESQITDRNMDIEQQGNRQSQSEQSLEEVDPVLLEELKRLDEQQKARKSDYEKEINRQREVLRRVLQNSYRKRIQYDEHISFYSRSTQKIAQREMVNSLTIKTLQEQQGTLKVKKSKKSTDEQERLSDAMNKQKKIYLQGLVGRLSKQQQKYESLGLDFYSLTLSALDPARMNDLKKLQELKDYELLCLIQRVNPNIQQIVCMNMNSIQEAVISCHRFNLTTPRSRRGELYQNIKNHYIQSKRLTSTSSSLFFPNKNSLLLSISEVLTSEDEILIISDKTQYSTTFSKFASRIGFTGGEQGMYILRYLIRACLKVAQELSQKLSNCSAVILPSNICLNQKFEFRFRNIVFNQFLFKQFKHLFSEDDFLFFPPEEKPDPSAVTLWSIGMLTYFLYFGVRPFAKYMPYSWSSRQCFFAVNELQIPTKSPASQKAKQFIFLCMRKKANTRNLLDLLNEPFLGGIVK